MDTIGGNQACQAIEPPREYPVNPSYGDVTIRKVSNGFVATVGCKTFVFVEPREVLEALAMYWTSPGEARRLYCLDEKEISK